jgi:hypothetical protein
VPRHAARLVVDYFADVARPGDSAHHAARCRLLLPRRASGCLGTSRGSSLTTSPTSRVRVTRHIARLVVDYFSHAARPGASARRAVRRRLLHLRCAFGCLGLSRGSSCRLIVDYFTYVARPGASARRASGCLGTSRGSSCGSSSITSPTPRVRVPRHVAWLISLLIVDYFASAARPSASTRRAARHVARRRLLRAPRLHLAATLALLQPRRASRLLVSRPH